MLLSSGLRAPTTQQTNPRKSHKLALQCARGESFSPKAKRQIQNQRTLP